MGVATLSSRAIIGEFYKTLQADSGAAWIGPLSMLFNSDQESEDYKWLGQTPAMREWVGGRHAKGFRENGFTIENLHYEATLEIAVKDMRRDKTSQVMTRIRELAQRTNSHWATLLSTLIVNGESAACYDGQFFFDTDHSEGDSGSQSNDISVDVSALPVQVATGTPAAPSVEQMQQTINKGITQIMSFVDDQGEPMNENASNFLVMAPFSLLNVAQNALSKPLDAGPATSNQLGGTSVAVVGNARLSSWTDKIAVFRTDGEVKPFVRQQETDVMLKAKAEGSEFEFDHDMHQYGVDTWRNVGYGYWQHACLVTMT